MVHFTLTFRAYVHQSVPVNGLICFSYGLPGSRLVELPGPLDLEHEVATVDKLHHKEQPVRGLKDERRVKRFSELPVSTRTSKSSKDKFKRCMKNLRKTIMIGVRLLCRILKYFNEIYKTDRDSTEFDKEKPGKMNS